MSSILIQGWLLLLLAVSPVAPEVLSDSVPPKPTPAPAEVGPTPAPFPVKQAGAVQPIIGAKSAILIDLPSQSILFEKDSTDPLPIASLTKLLTAQLVVERTRGDELLTVPEGAGVGADESRMGLIPGDQLTVDQLLAGLIIVSANDAAKVLARHVAGSEDGFTALMNDRADKMGLKDTHFDNPIGFGAGENYSTTREIAVLSRSAVSEPRIIAAAGVKEQKFSAANHPDHVYQLYTTDALLGGYLPIAGLKTGTSDAAGNCLISLLNSGDRQLLAIVLNSPDRFQENKSMLDWALRSYRW